MLCLLKLYLEGVQLKGFSLVEAETNQPKSGLDSYQSIYETVTLVVDFYNKNMYCKLKSHNNAEGLMFTSYIFGIFESIFGLKTTQNISR